MGETPSSQTVSTPLQQIAERARQLPEVALTTLAHHIDIEMLKGAYRRTRKDGAVGGDGQTADAYAEQLGVRLVSLLARFQAGTSVAPPVRRVMIPKAGGVRRGRSGFPPLKTRCCNGRSPWCWELCMNRTSGGAPTASVRGGQHIRRCRTCNAA